MLGPLMPEKHVTIPAAPNPLQAVADGIVERVRLDLRGELDALEQRLTLKQNEREKLWWDALKAVQGDVKEIRTDVDALKTTRIEISKTPAPVFTRADRLALWLIAIALTAAAIFSAQRTQQLAREPLIHGVVDGARPR